MIILFPFQAAIAEFESRLDECLAIREEGAIGLGGGDNASEESGSPKATQAMVAGSSRGGNRGKAGSSKTVPKSAAKGKAPAGGRGRRGGRQKPSSSESDSDSEEENMPPAASARAAARARQNKHKKITKVIESESSGKCLF